MPTFEEAGSADQAVMPLLAVNLRLARALLAVGNRAPEPRFADETALTPGRGPPPGSTSPVASGCDGSAG